MTIQAAIGALSTLLGQRLTCSKGELAQHGESETYFPLTLPDAVAYPETTEEVAGILRICAEHRCPVIGWGTGTSLEGQAQAFEGGVTVGALVVVNSAGDVVDPDTGLPWLAYQIEEFSLVPPPADERRAYADRHGELSPLNTTIAVVATDAALSPAGCRRVAVAAQDGLARTIRPCHTPLDGDTVFALATGAVEVVPDPTTPASMSPEVPLITAVGAAAADCLARAVLVGVLAAEELAGIPTYRGLLPGAFE